MKSDVLHQLTMMVSPFSFPESIPVYKLVQNPGDIILTFPRAFHGGYSEGWNCAEAVNFGTMDWLYLGQLAAKRCRSIRHYKNSVFSHDRLLWILFHKAKEANERSNALPESLKQAIIDAIHFEMETRTMLRSRLFNVREVVPARRWELDWESWTCESCHTHLFFSYVSCQCRSIFWIFLDRMGFVGEKREKCFAQWTLLNVKRFLVDVFRIYVSRERMKNLIN